jgi:hypothetical protein
MHIFIYIYIYIHTYMGGGGRRTLGAWAEEGTHFRWWIHRPEGRKEGNLERGKKGRYRREEPKEGTGGRTQRKEPEEETKRRNGRKKATKEGGRKRKEGTEGRKLAVFVGEERAPSTPGVTWLEMRT